MKAVVPLFLVVTLLPSFAKTSPSPIVSLVGGHSFACALLADSSLFCWGFLRADYSAPVDFSKPVRLPANASRGVTSLAAGASFACAAFENGGAKCWGANFSGQLGAGTSAEGLGGDLGEKLEDVPYLDLGPGRKVARLAGGLNHACAVLTSGEMKCWGNSSAGKLGQGNSQPRGETAVSMGEGLPPVDLGAGARATDLCLGTSHTCALLDDGAVKCWGEAPATGSGQSGTIGDLPGQMGDALPAVDLGSDLKASKIACGRNHTCALLSDGTIKCWGKNEGGVLGLGRTVDQSLGASAGQMGDRLPRVPLGRGLLATDISCGSLHCCAVLENRAVKCWGSNENGRLGVGDEFDRGSSLDEVGDQLPYVDLGKHSQVETVSLGRAFSCAILTSGDAKCWGHNRRSQLGNGTQRDVGTTASDMGEKLSILAFPSPARR